MWWFISVAHCILICTYTYSFHKALLLFACYVSYAWCSYVKKCIISWFFLGRNIMESAFVLFVQWLLMSMFFVAIAPIKSPLVPYTNERCKMYLTNDLIGQKKKMREIKLFPWIFHWMFHFLDNNTLDFNAILQKKNCIKISSPVIQFAKLFHSIAPPFLFNYLNGKNISSQWINSIPTKLIDSTDQIILFSLESILVFFSDDVKRRY